MSGDTIIMKKRTKLRCKIIIRLSIVFVLFFSATATTTKGGGQSDRLEKKTILMVDDYPILYRPTSIRTPCFFTTAVIKSDFIFTFIFQ